MNFVNEYVENMENLINYIMKSGNRKETKDLYEATLSFLNNVTNKGYGFCNCNNVIRHYNGGEVRVHTCGAGIFDSIKSAVNIGKNAYNANKKIYDYASNQIQKRIGGSIITVPQKKLKIEGLGFGWGRQDIGNTDNLVNWVHQGVQTAEDVGKLL